MNLIEAIKSGKPLNVVGLNLYRVLYLCPPVKTEFQKLVVAASDEEAQELVPGQFEVTLLERDISAVISPRAFDEPKVTVTRGQLLDAWEKSHRVECRSYSEFGEMCRALGLGE